MSNSKKTLFICNPDNNTEQSLIFGQMLAKEGPLKLNISNDGGAQFVATKSGMPDFIIKANAAVENERIDKAIEILSDEAVESVREILKEDPSRLDIMFVLAVLFDKTEQLCKAEEWYKKILTQEQNALVYYQLGRICQRTDRLCETIEYTRKAIQADPKNAKFLWNLGSSLMAVGEIQEGANILREVVEMQPANAKFHSAWLRSLHYLPEITDQTLFNEHKQWAQIHTPISQAKTNHNNSQEPDRRLRVGYISPDFRGHSVAYFFEPLLDSHDRQAVEVYGYANVASPDHVTERLKNKFDQYRDIAGIDAKKVSDLIEQDKIDILIDLAGHTSNNNLAVLAYKPAPVQVTYLGYPDTTGMEQVDYRLTDALADLPQSQQFYTEKLIFLPECFLCYKPSEFAPPVGPLPVSEKGYITFGSFNNNCKINPYIMELWVKILKANKNSRLLLKFKQGNDNGVKNYYLHQFEQLGVSPDRLEIFGWESKSDHLRLYNQVDIALDTYPYNGTTTTCEALWMGVPVISLVGEHHTSRVGLSILSRVGIEYFAVKTPQEYVTKASALSVKLDALAKIRSTMRSRIAASGLCYAKSFARNVEAVYRKMWYQWCQSPQANTVSENSKNEIQDGSKNTQKQKISSACDVTPQSDSKKKLSPIAELAVKIDTLCRTGHQAQTAPYASEGWNRLNSGEKAGDIPPEILHNWNARNEEILFIHFCISLTRYSGFYEPLVYIKLYNEWANRDTGNPLPYLRLGLLLAMVAEKAGLDMPPTCLEALHYAHNLMQNERSAAALAFAEGNVRELSLPYDGGRINLYPDLQTLTTFVLLEQGDWFEDELVLFRNLIRPDDKVLDLGANVGVYAISAALRTGRQGCVIALEPATETFKLLKASAEAFPNMTAVHGGISNESGTGWLCHGNSSEMNKFGNQEDKSEKVDMFSVDVLAEKMNIDSFDIIKMDVEGYEQKVLAGAEKIIGENSPIIFYEFRSGSGFNFKLIAAFTEIGYDSYYYIKGSSTLTKLHKNMELDAHFLNMVAMRPESIKRVETVVKVSTESNCQFSGKCLV